MTDSIEQQIWCRLTLVFKRRKAFEHWLNTYNILLDGECPHDLMKTEEGQIRVLAVLKEMVGA